MFDPVGGPYVDTLAQAMAYEGILFIYGGLSGQSTPYPHWPAAFKSLSVRGWVATAIWGRPERYARAQALILRGLKGGQFKPVIARSFPLTRSSRPTATWNPTSRSGRWWSRFPDGRGSSSVLAEHLGDAHCGGQDQYAQQAGEDEQDQRER